MINIFHRSAEFAQKHKHHHHLFLAVFALIVAGTGAYTFRHEIVQAATFTFTQSSWATLDTNSEANDQTDRLNWSKYTATSSDMNIVLDGSNHPTLRTVSFAFTDDGATSTTPTTATYGGGFGNGTTATTTITNNNGTADASVRLQTVPIDVGTGADGAYSCTSGTCYLGNNWNSVTYGTPGGSPLFVAVANSHRVMTSSNGTDWTLRVSAANNNWTSVTYGTPGGSPLFVAVASSGTGNRVMKSSDGINWSSAGITGVPDNNWTSVTYGTPGGSPLFVAVASSGTGNRVMKSSDGINWSSAGITGVPDNNWTSVTYGNNRFVAGANYSTSGLMTSTDGITWASSATEIANRHNVTYGNGLFVVLFYNSTDGLLSGVFTSPDGITWTYGSGSSYGSNYWTSLTYGNGYFVAVANTGTGNRVMTSPDVITWTGITGVPDNNWTSVTYGTPGGSPLFVAVANSGTDNGRVMTSPNGTTWTLGTSAVDTHNYTTFDISAGAEVIVTETAALTIKATGNVTIAGTLSANGGAGVNTSTAGTSVAGGFSGGTNLIAGGGNGGAPIAPACAGGGGGSYGAAGGAGSNGGTAGTFSEVDSESFGGGAGAVTTTCTLPQSGGASGGNIKIQSGGTISVSGTLSALGGAGAYRQSGAATNYPGGGGGSGGRIHLLGNTVTNTGTISVKGGAGGLGRGATGRGGGGGSGGRIYMYGNTVTPATPNLDGGAGGTGTGGAGVAGSTATLVSGLLPYYASGTFTSDVINLGAKTNFSSIAYGAGTTLPAGTSITFNVRAGDAPNTDHASWSTWSSNIASGEDISVIDGKQYFQYRANLGGDTVSTPTLASVIINQIQYATTGNLTSSVYNTMDSTNVISNMLWEASSVTPGSEEVNFQVRSSADGSTNWTNWCGASNACLGTDYFTISTGVVGGLTSTHPLASSTADPITKDKFLQYKVFLISGGYVAPTLTQAQVQYVINAAPEIQSVIAIPNANSIVTVTYEARDIDSATDGSETPNALAVTLQYCTTGTCTVSSDSGWVDASAVTGAVGSGAVCGPSDASLTNLCVPTGAGAGTGWTAKSITWTPAPQYSDIYNASQKIRIKAYDSEGANNLGYAIPASAFVLDTTVPALTTFNVAASSTPGTVNLTITDSSSPEFRLCDDSGYTTGCTDWTGITTATPTPVTKTLANNVNGRPEVYLQVRDAYGNTNSGSATAPATPGTLLVADVANPTANYFGETLSWSVSAGVAGTNGYKIWYATTTEENSTPPSTYTYLGPSTSNVYTHTITTATTSAYWYRVTAVSSNSDISNFSIAMVHGDIPDSFGTSAPDATPPVISNISAPVAGLRSSSVVAEFTTDELATSTVLYGTSFLADCSYGTTKTTASFVTSQSVTVDNLQPSTTYYYCVKATDVVGNTSLATSGGTFATVGGPTISSVTVQNLAGTSATIMWNTATSSDSYIYYSTSNSLLNPVAVGSTTMVPCTGNVCQHQVGLSGLTAGTIYYFKVKSTDSDTNSITDTNSGSYYSFTTLADTTAPALVGNIETPVKAPTAAVIVWQTDEPATSQANWGLASTTLTRFTVNDSTKSIYHVVTLSSGTLDNTSVSQELTPETPYYFTVISADAANNTMTSSVQTFTTPADGNVTVTVVSVRAADTTDTTPPAISNVTVSDITPFSAIVKFGTDEDADAFVEHGKDITYENTAGDKTWTKEHIVKLRGLTLGTEYHIKVTAHDKAGNTGTSADQTFKTTFLSENLKDMANIENIEQFQKEIESAIESILPSLVPPFITKPVISDITENSAKISFRSNIKAFPVVVFAEGGAYDETKENPYTGEVSDTTEKATSHELALTGLKGNTKYHIQARGFSLPKVIGKSVDVTFITKASKIAGSIVERKKDSFTVVWTTEQPTTTIVEYKDLKRGITGRKTDDAKKTSHSMKIENLPSGTAYEVNLSGLTEQGNIAEAGSPLSVTTSTDVTPPAISGFKVDNALVPGRTDRIQTIVSWVTDEPSNSTAYYQEGAGAPGDTEELANKNEVLDSYVLSHSVILPSLKPGTIYRLKVTSSDDSGNEGSFGPRTVITPKQTESITDIIFKNFEDSFKFLRKI